jgi:hypothetical protein
VALVSQEPAPKGSFADDFRTAKTSSDKKLVIAKAYASGTIVPDIVSAAEEGRPLASLQNWKSVIPKDVTLPERVNLDRLKLRPVKPAGAQQAAKSHASDDPNRFVLNGVFHDADAQMVVATDGRRLVAIPKKIDGNSRIARLDTKGPLGDKDIDGNFPNWRQVIPTFNRSLTLHSIDIDKARRAGTVLAGINKTVGKLAASPAKVMIGGALLDPSYVKDAVEALVASGAETIRAASAPATWEQGQVRSEAAITSPILLRGDNGALAVIMPIQSKKNDLVVDVSTVIPERVGNEWLETIQMFEGGKQDTPAKKSRRRIKNMTAQSGAIDLSIVEDLVEYGKTIYRAGMSFGKWAGEMVKEFGQGIASFLKQAFDRIVQAYKDSPYSDTTGAIGDVRPKAKPRQFEQKAAKAPGISEEARAQMGNDPYVPITLRGVAEQAKAWIGENGIEAAERRILGLADEGQTPTPLDFAIGLELTANLSATGNAGRAAAVVRTMSRRASRASRRKALSSTPTRSSSSTSAASRPSGRPRFVRRRMTWPILRRRSPPHASGRQRMPSSTASQGGEKIQDKLKRRIPDKAKKQDTNVSIRSVLTSQATKAEATKQITQILTESGISQSEATALATAITNRFYKVLEDARKALASSRKPAKGKGRVDD